MKLGTIASVNNVPIRLTEERWQHINDSHPSDFDYYYPEDVLDAVGTPEYILRGSGGALVAVEVRGGRGFLHVIYREVDETDGFIITAFYKTDFDRERIVWRANDDAR